MQLNPLSELLKNLQLPSRPAHQPSLPAPRVTPKPETNKVVNDPTRTPVNKQAALILAPVNCWLSKPLPPEKLPTPEDARVAELKAELKTERNTHAETRDSLGQAYRRIKELTAALSALQQQVDSLKAQCREKDSIIQQLEDLRL